MEKLLKEEKRKGCNYKKLQNGSDIRGVAMEGVSGETPNLTEREAQRLAAGFALWLSEKTGKPSSKLRIAVGRDPRLSGEALLSGVIKGLLPWGITVFDCGLSSTPAMFMATIFPEYRCDGAIMITASHLPFNRNGFKYFDRDGGLNKEDIAAIIAYGEEGVEHREKKRVDGEENKGGLEEKEGGLEENEGSLEKTDLLAVYAAFLRKKIVDGVRRPGDPERPLSGLKIVVDAGNGSGGFYAERVLAPLGADVSGSQYLKPDGSFPNHAPNPEDKEAMKAISQKVLAENADFGLIFDTDVDRSSAVDKNGKEINRNGIVAMAAALVAEEHPGTTVVTDSITSDQLTLFIEEGLGLTHLRFKRGYKNVINEAVRLNKEGINSQLAIETSGHAALAENYFLDDGAYLATKIVIKAARLALEGKTLDSVIAGLEEPKEAVELRFPIEGEEFSAYGDDIIADLQAFVRSGGADNGKEWGEACGGAWSEVCDETCGISLVEPNYEGVRISFDREHGNGWCLLRKSLHDPIMPLNIESGEEGGCARIGGILKEFLKKYDRLNIGGLDF